MSARRPAPLARRLVVLVVAVTASVWTVAGCAGSARDATAFDFDYVIPEGTYERVQRGEHVDIFPEELRATVGQRIRIVNRDEVGQTIGPYYIGPRSTVQQTFRKAGTVEGICTTHPDRSIRIVVAGRGNDTGGERPS